MKKSAKILLGIFGGVLLTGIAVGYCLAIKKVQMCECETDDCDCEEGDSKTCCYCFK